MNYLTDKQKHIVWDHFVAEAFINGPSTGMTGKRLAKIKPVIWRDENFWFNMARGGLNKQMPHELKEAEPGRYDHTLGNFRGLCMATIRGMGLI